jgi:hypothetical protein
MMGLIELYLTAGGISALVLFFLAPIMFGGDPTAFGKWTVPLILFTVVLWPLTWIGLFVIATMDE